MAIIDSLNNLENRINTAKQTLTTNLNNKGVASITTASTLTEMVDSVSGITTGGGSADQWEEIGYTSQPQYITDGIEYAKKIQSEWDSSQISLPYKFKDDLKLRYMPLVDTSKVTNMYGMFYECNSLTTIPELNTSNVKDMREMFYKCASLIAIPSLNTSNITETQNMFYNCSSLTTIPQIDTSKVTNMYCMFSGCSSLTTIPQIDTSKVIKMGEMFYFCKSLTTIPQIDTSKVTNMHWMFSGCSSLTTIPELNTSNVKDMSYMIEGCHKLRYLKLIGLGTQSALTYIVLGGTYDDKLLGIDGDGVTGCKQALIDTLITNSFDRATAGYSPCQIQLSAETKALLTEDELAQITDKGFTIA